MKPFIKWGSNDVFPPLPNAILMNNIHIINTFVRNTASMGDTDDNFRQSISILTTHQ